MNITMCLGTEKRVSEVNVKMKQRGPCRGQDTGCESSGESSYITKLIRITCDLYF